MTRSGLDDTERQALDGSSGVFGTVVRLRPDAVTGPGGLPPSLILKLPSGAPENRSRAIAFGLYEREARFYREVAPGFALRVPRCYGSWLEPGGEAALLLEDLGHLAPGDLLCGISPGRAMLAVECLARAHAQWWDQPRLGDLPWVPALADPPMSGLADACRELWPAFVELHAGDLPPGSIGLGERVVPWLPELLARLSRSPVTLAHGDFRVDNLFFDDPQATHSVAVVDWQLVSRCRGAFDVAYLLCQSMWSVQRRRHEMAILARWHEALLDAGVCGYNFDQAIADYRCAALVSVGYAIAGAALDRTNLRGALIARAQAVRAFTAALELHSPGADEVAS